MNVELISFSGELGNQLAFFLFLTVTTEMQETSMILKHPKITFCQRLLYKSPKVIAGKATPIANIFFHDSNKTHNMNTKQHCEGLPTIRNV